MSNGKKKNQSNGIFIELLNPSRSYLAGQTIQGKVVIDNDKPTQVKEVTVSLKGSGRVHWTEIQIYEEDETLTVNGQSITVQKTKIRTVSFDAEEKYEDRKKSLVGDGHNLMKLPEGRISYPFHFKLRENLPSSFTSKRGLVSYFLEAELRRPFLKTNRRHVIPFTVNGIYDLNLDHTAALSQEVRRSKGSNWFACRRGQLGFILSLPRRSGFVPGEILDFACEIANSSNKRVTGVKATLFQNISYLAEGKTKHERKAITHVSGPGLDVGEDENEMWSPNCLVIPPVPPTTLGGVCTIIDIDYSLHMEMKISGLTSSLTGDLPVVIGTIPLRSTFEEIRQLPQASGAGRPLPMPSSSGNGKSEVGFVVPSTSQQSQSPLPGEQDPVPSAPLLSDYPDLPPPSYLEAVAVESFSGDWSSSGADNGDNGNEGESAGKSKIESSTNGEDKYPGVSSKCSEFVPNYITYGSSGN